MQFPVSKKDITFDENNTNPHRTNRFNSNHHQAHNQPNATLFRYPAYSIGKSSRFIALKAVPYKASQPGISTVKHAK